MVPEEFRGISCICFFDDNVSANTILKMTRALQKPGAEHPPKRTSVIPAQANSMQLHDFVTESILRFFNITGLPATFLEKDVDTWTWDEAYMSAKATVM